MDEKPKLTYAQLKYERGRMKAREHLQPFPLVDRLDAPKNRKVSEDYVRSNADLVEKYLEDGTEWVVERLNEIYFYNYGWYREILETHIVSLLVKLLRWKNSP